MLQNIYHDEESQGLESGFYEPLLPDDELDQSPHTASMSSQSISGDEGIGKKKDLSYWDLQALPPDFLFLPITIPGLIRVVAIITAIAIATMKVLKWIGFDFLTNFEVFPIFIAFSSILIFVVNIMINVRQCEALGPIRYLQFQLKCNQLLWGCESPQVAAILYKIGLVHERLGEPEEALTAFKSICTTVPGTNSCYGGSMVQHAIGRILFSSLHRYNEALCAFQVALQLRRHNPNDVFGAQKEIQCIALTYGRLGDLDMALETLLSGLQELRSCGDAVLKSMDTAKCYVLIGTTYEYMDQYRDAVLHYKEALKIFHYNWGDLPWNSSVARLHTKIGYATLKLEEAEASDRENREHDHEMIKDACNSFQAAIDVYKRGGKADDFVEIVRLRDCIARFH